MAVLALLHVQMVLVRTTDGQILVVTIHSVRGLLRFFTSHAA